jgi:hypothetical protein
MEQLEQKCGGRVQYGSRENQGRKILVAPHWSENKQQYNKNSTKYFKVSCMRKKDWIIIV